MAINVGVAALLALGAAVAIGFGVGHPGSQDPPKEVNGKVDASVVSLNMESPKRKDKVIMSEEEWQKILTPEQYKILRNAGTEAPFCGINLEYKGEGEYVCVGCGLALFKAGNKFDSGTGWPSFGEPIDKDNVWYHTDKAFGMKRTEILCARCDGHLGHVFDDGPPPTHLRYCINGTVLKFVPKKAE